MRLRYLQRCGFERNSILNPSFMPWSGVHQCWNCSLKLDLKWLENSEAECLANSGLLAMIFPKGRAPQVYFPHGFETWRSKQWVRSWNGTSVGNKGCFHMNELLIMKFEVWLILGIYRIYSSKWIPSQNVPHGDGEQASSITIIHSGQYWWRIFG